MTDAPRRSRRRRWGAVLGAVLALAGAGVVVVLVSQARYDLPDGELFADGAPSPTSPSAPSPTPSPPPGSSPTPSPVPSPTPEPGADIAGPLNILLAGIDARPGQPEWRPNSDAVLVMHVDAPLERAYLFSLPRDLLVDVPAFEPAGFSGRYTKLTHAMSYGSRVPGRDLPDTAQGFALLAATVSQYTGIDRFDAGAVLNFPGFTDLVDALGGVDMYVDQRVASIHREPDGTHRELQPGGGGYVGPQKVYEVGEQHLEGWEALDYARQRYIPGGDYARQRHQRQLIRALVGEVTDHDLRVNPGRLDRVLRAAGDALVFDGRGHSIVDYAFALRRIRAGDIVLVELPGSSVYRGGTYQGEQLAPVAGDFLGAVRQDRVGEFLADHPGLVGPPY